VSEAAHLSKGRQRKLVVRAQGMGAAYVLGQLTDQVAADGSLPPIPPLPASLHETFPASRRILGVILGAPTSKVCLLRGQLAISGGQHFPSRGRPYPDIIPVLHYKWHAKVLDRLRRPEEHHQQELAHTPESKRALDYLTSNSRFDMQDANLLS